MDDETPKNQASSPNTSNEGAQIAGNVSTEGGDLIGRDKTVDGDEVGRDKVGRDLYNVSAQQVVIHQYQTLATPVADRILASEEPAPGESPYKGLEFFNVADAGIFFGREQLTAELVAHIRQHRFLAVVGASGSGKSSVVRAGLVPALISGEPLVDGTLPPSGSEHWLVSILTPTARPLKELATKLTPDESDKITLAVMDDLASDARVLDVRASKLLAQSPSHSHLLLVIDQFEELFTQCKDKDERKAFVDNILTAVAVAGPTLTVITLRADFYAHCAEFDNLRTALERYQRFIGPMSQDELRQAIEEPAHLGGWAFEPGLVDLLLQDVGSEPGALPLLSHALLETWQRRRGRTLTFAGYQAAGRVQGAIAQTANRVYTELSPDQQQIARNIFLRLTELGEGAQDTRRRVDLDEMIPNLEDKSEVEIVLSTLADARLVTTFQEEVEVAHEALIREWPMLRGWLAENREWLRLHRRLTEAAQEWTEQGRNPDLLYRPTTLEQTLERAKGHDHEFNELERNFLKASQDTVEAVAREQDAARQQELKQARKVRNRALIAFVAIAAALLLASVNVWQLYKQNWRLSSDWMRQAFINQSIALAANASRAIQDNNYELAIPLAVAANQIPDPPALAVNALAAAVYVPSTQRYFTGHSMDVTGVAFSPDGNLALTGSLDKSAKLWDTKTGNVVHQLDQTQLAGVTSVAYSPTGQQALLGLENGRLVVWDVTTGEILYNLAGPPQGITQAITALAYSPDGQRALLGDKAGGLMLWDVANGKPLLTLAGHQEGVTAVAISPDGRSALSGARDNRMVLWNLDTGAVFQQFEGHKRAIILVAYGPFADNVLSGSLDGNVVVWNIETGEPAGGFALNEHTQNIGSIAVAPNDASVISGAWDGSIILWDKPPIGAYVRSFVGHRAPVISLAYSKDGRYVLSGAKDGEVRLWDIGGPAQLRRFTVEPPLVNRSMIDPIYNLSLDEAHHRAFSGAAGALILWDLATGEEIHRFPAPADRLSSVALSPDGATALSAADGDLTLWNLTTYTAVRTLAGHSAKVLNIAYGTEGQTALSVSNDGVVIGWNLATGQSTWRHDLPKDDIWSIAFSTDGRFALTGSEDSSVILWDLASGQEIHRFEGHHDAVYSVALSPDGQTALTGSADRQIILWNLGNGKLIRTFQGHTLAIHTVAYSPDGHTILSGGEDHTIRFWNIAMGAEIFRFEGHSSTIQNVLYLRDTPRFLSRGADGSLILWAFPPTDGKGLIAWTYANRYVRDLTCEERTFYNVEPLCDLTH